MEDKTEFDKDKIIINGKEFKITEWRKKDLEEKAKKDLTPKKPLNVEEEAKRHQWMLKNEELFF